MKSHFFPVIFKYFEFYRIDSFRKGGNEKNMYPTFSAKKQFEILRIDKRIVSLKLRRKADYVTSGSVIKVEILRPTQFSSMGPLRPKLNLAIIKIVRNRDGVLRL